MDRSQPVPPEVGIGEVTTDGPVTYQCPIDSCDWTYAAFSTSKIAYGAALDERIVEDTLREHAGTHRAMEWLAALRTANDNAERSVAMAARVLETLDLAVMLLPQEGVDQLGIKQEFIDNLLPGASSAGVKVGGHSARVTPTTE